MPHIEEFPHDAIAATEALSPAIQKLFDAGFQIEEVAIAISDVFFLCLMSAGAERSFLEKDSKRLHKKFAGRGYNKRRAKVAVEQLGKTVSELERGNIAPDAIAWSLAAALVKIVRAIMPDSAVQIDDLTYGLIQRLNMVEAD